MRKASLERYYFVLYNGALTLKMSNMALNPFCDKTLHMIRYSALHILLGRYPAVYSVHWMHKKIILISTFSFK